MTASPDLSTSQNRKNSDWRPRLEHVVSTMQELSRQTDPQDMVRTYGDRMKTLLPIDRRVSLSRRDLKAPMVRVTRFTGWEEDIDPWKDTAKLPVLYGGLFADLIYANEPRIIQDVEFDEKDPARKFFDGMRSILAIPLYDQGEALNMVVLARSEPNGFDESQLPEWVWMSNLFGRATQTLVVKRKMQEMYDEIARDLDHVAKIQRALLPEKIPSISTMEIAAYYQTSARAGGDYYDFIELPDGRWGILIADVSGHGTPAAVVMSITHGMVHTYEGPTDKPSQLLHYLNERLYRRYTSNIGGFVTAFYAMYNPKTRTLDYASAGHNPPRIKRCNDGSVISLDQAQSLPLGITDGVDYFDASHTLVPGDQVVLYTDGITEAMDPQGHMFGTERLDMGLANCMLTADGLIETVIGGVNDFTANHPADDDRTLLVAKVS